MIAWALVFIIVLIDASISYELIKRIYKMNDIAKAKDKIRRYKQFIQALEDEKKIFQRYLDNNLYTELQAAQIKQRVFDIEVTINGHEAFIKEYQDRLNPTTYRKSIY
jgi:LPS O-antigen subunit length determinant protein (WzzB/FepE family)